MSHQHSAAWTCENEHPGVELPLSVPRGERCPLCNAAEPAAASGCELIAVERQRQIDAEGWTPDHDDGHTLGEMAVAGACYALLSTRWKDSAVLGAPLIRSILWPWDDEWFKPTDYPESPYTADVHTDRHVRDLVKAGALIAAEIDRLQRSRRV